MRLADEAFCIGGAAARDSYLRADAILDVCRSVGGRSVHPGYGFLSENAAFADTCHQSGVAFVGPPGSAIRAMGDKSEAKRIMSEAGVPVVPGAMGELLQGAGCVRLCGGLLGPTRGARDARYVGGVSSTWYQLCSDGFKIRTQTFLPRL